MSNSPKETETHPSEATTRLWIRLMRAQRLILAAIEQDLKASGMPPLAWYDVLWELVRAREGRLRPYEIEERTLLAQHNLSRLLDRMEEAGLVRREVLPEDGRGRWVLISDAGRAMQASMWTVYAAAIERHLGAKLNDATAAALADGLEVLARGG